MAALASSSSYSSVGWSSSSFSGAGAGLGVERPSRVQLRRGRGGAELIRAAADEEEEPESFLKGIGTTFLKIGGTKKESAKNAETDDKQGGTQFFGLGAKKKKVAEEEEEPKKSGTQFFNFGTQKKKAVEEEEEPKKSGTQFFNFGTQKKKVAEEEEEPKKSGTQFFNFGTQKKAGGTQAVTTNGSALAVQKGTQALESLPFGRGRRVDPKTVFVAGATGQIGARISQKLLRAGFSVRGGVPDLYVAQQLAEFATQYGVISRDEAKRLNAVEFDFNNVSSIAKALGNAGKVVVTVGPSEDGPSGKVTTDDAARVLEAATISNAAHFVLVTEPGTGVSSENGPLAGLAALFGNLFSKGAEISESDLVDKLLETNLPYTFIKAASTVGVDDYAPEGGNLVVEAEGAADPSAKVSKIQIAEVVAGAFQYAGSSENKVFEVTSSPYAPSRPVDELLSGIQVDGRRELLQEEKARLAAEEKERTIRLAAEEKETTRRLAEEEKERALRSKMEAEAKEAVEEAREATQLAAQLEAEAKRLSAEEAKAAAFAAKAQARADAAAASVDGLQEKAKELGGGPLTTIAGRLGTVSFKLDDKVKKGAGSVKLEAKAKKPAFSLPKLGQKAEDEEKPSKPAFSFLKKAPKAEEEEKPSKPAFSFPKLGQKAEDEEKPSKPAFSSQKKAQRAPPQPVAAAASAPPKSGGLFGLFGPQETLYVDDD